MYVNMPNKARRRLEKAQFFGYIQLKLFHLRTERFSLITKPLGEIKAESINWHRVSEA